MWLLALVVHAHAHAQQCAGAASSSGDVHMFEPLPGTDLGPCNGTRSVFHVQKAYNCTCRVFPDHGLIV